MANTPSLNSSSLCVFMSAPATWKPRVSREVNRKVRFPPIRHSEGPLVAQNAMTAFDPWRTSGESAYSPLSEPLGGGMDIHKPKPWHGWREFLKEYAIIVVGVLTALGAESLVETMRWSHAVEGSREQLTEDARSIVRQAGMLDSQSQCLAREFESYGALLDRASETGRL